MNAFKVLFLALVILLVGASSGAGADFDWLKDLNIQAQADPSGFRARLAARFKIGEAEITTVLGNVGRAADAYMVFRMGELSRRPVEEVLDEYKANTGKGWGVIAKRLGIKPGSREFHALKKGHDLDRGKKPKGKVKGKDKDKAKGPGKG